VLAYYLPFGGDSTKAVIYVGTELLATIAVFASIRLHRPARPAAWALIGLAMLSITLGDAVWYWLDIVANSPVTPSAADVLYLVEYPLFLAALVVIARGKPLRSVWLDTITITLGGTVVVWELVVRPTLETSTTEPLSIVIAVAYPLGDLAILAAVMGLALSSALRTTAIRLVAVGFVIALAADMGNLWLSVSGITLDPSPLDAGWLATMLIWAAAALHPSSRQELVRQPVDWFRERAPRLTVLFAAALVVPGSLAIEALVGARQDLPLALATWAILVLMLALRMERLIAEVRRSERPFRTIFEGSPAGIGLSRGEEILDVNEAVRDMFGYADRDSMAALPLGAHVAAPLDPELPELLRHRDALATLDQTYETVGTRADGSEFPLVIRARRIDLADGPATIGFYADVSAQRAAERTLRESESRYRHLFDANPNVMWVYDAETLRFVAVNDMAVQEYGWTREEFLGMTIADVRRPEDVPALLESAARVEEIQFSGPWTHRLRDGTLHLVDIASHAIDWEGRPARLVLVTDQTARLRLEEQLRQAQKMEAVGRLAGGVAHDFNNLLTAIAGYAQLLREGLDPSDERMADVDEILSASTRATALTRQLLAFSRRQVLQPQILDLNVTIRGMRGMLDRLIGENVEIRVQLAPDLGRVRADPGQVAQVIMNLVVNARDAMPTGGTVTLETANLVLDESDVQTHPGTGSGPHVMLAVTDTGSGMDIETQRHLFEPFFTTKPVGQGTGLGLATVYGIVKQSGGSIWAYSEPGRGTTFKIYLPQSEEASTTPLASLAPVESADGQETILVVEDEAAVRRLVTTVLSGHGYRVLEADRPDSALAAARAFPGRIHLLLSDVIMPGGSGPELAARIVAIRPDTRVLFMSGYTRDAIVHHGVLDDGVSFVEKPFSPETVLRRVRDILEGPARR
jgi:hypothetical protein